MSARRVAVLGTIAALAGCPLPQPLPDYPAGAVTPPRIVGGSPSHEAESIIAVPAGCPTEPVYELDARIYYQDSVTLEARWFVDYRRDVAQRAAVLNAGNTSVVADPDPLVLERRVPPFTFKPYRYFPPEELGAGSDRTAAGVVHVVELVVSNGFDTGADLALPNRTPALVPGSTARFEIQTYRWVFVNVSPSGALACPP